MNLSTVLKKIKNKISIKKNRILNKSNFQKYVNENIPSNFIDLINFSFYQNVSKKDYAIGRNIENLRNSLAIEYKDKKISTFASPHSGTKLFNEDGSVIPGSFVESKNAGFARTGTGIVTGIQLKKITEAIDASSIIELGTNTGLSGAYFLHAINSPHLLTIEGSSDLCKIAEKNLSLMSNKDFDVINGMFDDEIDRLFNMGKRFDLAFVDGQHEEQATLHYAEKLKSILNPGGAILFDDIFWSEGMNSAWNKVASDPDYCMSFDLGTRGLCILKEENMKTNRIKFELTNYTGKPLYNREGW
tara:strand:+ start:14320 stop:15225 length:906 start_codon:yes stop_codon:yes gene_type:complete